ERIEPQRLLDQCGEPIDALPEVHRFAVHVDLQRWVESEHGRPNSASITVRTSVASAPSQASSSATPFGRRARMLGATAGDAIGKCAATSCATGSFTSANTA